MVHHSDSMAAKDADVIGSDENAASLGSFGAVSYERSCFVVVSPVVGAADMSCSAAKIADSSWMNGLIEFARASFPPPLYLSSLVVVLIETQPAVSKGSHCRRCASSCVRSPIPR